MPKHADGLCRYIFVAFKRYLVVINFTKLLLHVFVCFRQFPFKLVYLYAFFFSPRSDSTLLLTKSQYGEINTYFCCHVMFGFFCDLSCIQF